MKKTLIFAMSLLIVCGGFALFAGPTVLRDERIQDTALTPTLGRGYTIATNTFQSKCLDNVQITDPSYDFKYIFEQVDSLTPGSQSQPGGSDDIKIKDKYTDSKGKTVFLKNINVVIYMNTYYASVDEARTTLSGTAAQLLTKNDIPGFFMSCGSYYVRSIGRHARFKSVFTYSQDVDQRDEAFEQELEMAIKSFGREPDAGSVMQSAGNKKLTITTNAYGLGKSEGATLISYDLAGFKAAIKDAFLSMQNPMTGKVTTMEVVPWVENTEFQSLVNMDKPEKDPKTGKEMLLYKKKRNLTLNGEFLAEIDRADRNMMNIYYKAKMCRQKIDANWTYAEGAGGAKKVHPRYVNAEVKSNRFPRDKDRRIKLSDLYNKLIDTELDKLLNAEQKFINEGASACMEGMMTSGISTKIFTEIAACNKIKSQFSAVGSDIIDEYCMPKLAKTKRTTGGTEKKTP